MNETNFFWGLLIRGFMTSLVGLPMACHAQETTAAPPAMNSYTVEGYSSIGSFSGTLSIQQQTESRATVRLSVADGANIQSAAELVQSSEGVFVGSNESNDRFVLRLSSSGVSGAIELGGTLYAVRSRAEVVAAAWVDVALDAKFRVQLPTVSCHTHNSGLTAVISTSGSPGGSLRFDWFDSGLEPRFLDALGASRLPLVEGWKKHSSSRFHEPTSTTQNWRIWRNRGQKIVYVMVLVAGEGGSSVLVSGSFREPDESDWVVDLVERIVNTIRFDSR